MAAAFNRLLTPDDVDGLGQGEFVMSTEAILRFLPLLGGTVSSLPADVGVGVSSLSISSSSNGALRGRASACHIFSSSSSAAGEGRSIIWGRDASRLAENRSISFFKESWKCALLATPVIVSVTSVLNARSSRSTAMTGFSPRGAAGLPLAGAGSEDGGLVVTVGAAGAMRCALDFAPCLGGVSGDGVPEDGGTVALAASLERVAGPVGSASRGASATGSVVAVTAFLPLADFRASGPEVADPTAGVGTAGTGAAGSAGATEAVVLGVFEAGGVEAAGSGTARAGAGDSEDAASSAEVTAGAAVGVASLAGWMSHVPTASIGAGANAGSSTGEPWTDAAGIPTGAVASAGSSTGGGGVPDAGFPSSIVVSAADTRRTHESRESAGMNSAAWVGAAGAGCPSWVSASASASASVSGAGEFGVGLGIAVGDAPSMEPCEDITSAAWSF